MKKGLLVVSVVVIITLFVFIIRSFYPSIPHPNSTPIKSKQQAQPASLKAKAVQTKSTAKNTEAQFCAPVANAFKKLDQIAKSPSVTKKRITEKEQEHIMWVSFYNAATFKDLENTASLDNECGASALNLTLSTYQGLNLNDKEKVANDKMLAFAKNNNKVAMRYICYSDENIVNQDETESFCTILLQKDNADAMARLKLISIYADQKNIDKIDLLCHNKTASKIICYNDLADIGSYFEDHKNYVKAFDAYDRAAQYDDSGDANFHLAEMYFSGEGTPVNLDMAIAFYQKALSEFKPTNIMRVFALNDLGSAFEQQRDYVAAFKAYQTAAEMGFSLSQFNLSGLYARGLGVIQDDQQAYAWISVAVAKGLPDKDQQDGAEKIKAILTQQLLAEDSSGIKLQEAQDLAKQYYNKYVI